MSVMRHETAADFYAEYCRRSGLDPILLAGYGRRAYRCECGDETCEGWAMLNAKDEEFNREHGCPTPGTSASDPGYAPAFAYSTLILADGPAGYWLDSK